MKWVEVQNAVERILKNWLVVAMKSLVNR